MWMLWSCTTRKESSVAGTIATFNVDHKSSKELRQYLAHIAEQCEHGATELPTIIVLDNLHHVSSLAEVFNGFLSIKHVHWSVHTVYLHSVICWQPCLVPVVSTFGLRQPVTSDAKWRLCTKLLHVDLKLYAVLLSLRWAITRQLYNGHTDPGKSLKVTGFKS